MFESNRGTNTAARIALVIGNNGPCRAPISDRSTFEAGVNTVPSADQTTTMNIK